MKEDNVQSISERTEEEACSKAERKSFDPVISKITKPLKPQGVHAGLISVSVKGNF